jgi:hypothetical protein
MGRAETRAVAARVAHTSVLAPTLHRVTHTVHRELWGLSRVRESTVGLSWRRTPESIGGAGDGGPRWQLASRQT